MRNRARTVLLAFALAVTGANRASAKSPTIGTKCAEVGTTAHGRTPLTCADIGKDRYVWARITPTAATKPTTSIGAPSKTVTAAKETPSQKNARQKAKSYLEFSAFSRSGLIKQLEFEEFTNQDATYGVDILTVDWNEQAAKKAKAYLGTSSLSRRGLIKQLEFEGFTQAQAEYGVSTTGL